MIAKNGETDHYDLGNKNLTPAAKFTGL